MSSKANMGVCENKKHGIFGSRELCGNYEAATPRQWTTTSCSLRFSNRHGKGFWLKTKRGLSDKGPQLAYLNSKSREQWVKWLLPFALSLAHTQWQIHYFEIPFKVLLDLPYFRILLSRWLKHVFCIFFSLLQQRIMPKYWFYNLNSFTI